MYPTYFLRLSNGNFPLGNGPGRDSAHAIHQSCFIQRGEPGFTLGRGGAEYVPVWLVIMGVDQNSHWFSSFRGVLSGFALGIQWTQKLKALNSLSQKL